MDSRMLRKTTWELKVRPDFGEALCMTSKSWTRWSSSGFFCCPIFFSLRATKQSKTFDHSALIYNSASSIIEIQAFQNLSSEVSYLIFNYCFQSLNFSTAAVNAAGTMNKHWSSPDSPQMITVTPNDTFIHSCPLFREQSSARRWLTTLDVTWPFKMNFSYRPGRRLIQKLRRKFDYLSLKENCLSRWASSGGGRVDTVCESWSQTRNNGFIYLEGSNKYVLMQ